MAKGYRPVLRDQVFLLPPDMREWLPADHLVWFLLETIEVLDTSEFDRRRRRGGVGAAGYDPRMLLGLLIYAYGRGIRSSRQIERLCSTDVAFRVLCAQDIPDHCTIARFRAECQDAFTGLFTQVLMIAGHAGLGHFGTVAIDDTKIAANASIDANRGHEWLSEQVTRMVAEAEQTDATENIRAAQGSDDDGERVPARLMDQSSRARRIRQAADEVAAQLKRQRNNEDERDAAARARLAKSQAGEPMVGRIPDGPHRLAEARAHLAREIATHQSKLERRAAVIAAGKKPMGAPPVPLDQHSRIIRARRVVEAALTAEHAAPATNPGKRVLPKTVANTTDPQSRLMPTDTIAVEENPFGVAITPDETRVYVTNTDSESVSVIDTATNTVTATVAVGNEPRHVAITPDGTRAYVTRVFDNIVSVIDTATNTVTATVAVTEDPIGVAITPDGTRAYITHSLPDTVSVIDTVTNTVTTTIGVGVRTSPEGIAVTPDGTRVYVTNTDDNSVSVISTATNTVTTTVSVGETPTGVSITPDGTRAYVTNTDDDTVSVITIGDTPCTGSLCTGSSSGSSSGSRGSLFGS